MLLLSRLREGREFESWQVVLEVATFLIAFKMCFISKYFKTTLFYLDMKKDATTICPSTDGSLLASVT